MTRNIKEWLIVVTLPLFIIGTISSIMYGNLAGMLVGLWLPIGGIVGIFAGFSDAPIYTVDFKLQLALVLAVALFIISFAFKHHKKLWGKIAIVAGIYLWCFAGTIALGMSG